MNLLRLSNQTRIRQRVQECKLAMFGIFAAVCISNVKAQDSASTSAQIEQGEAVFEYWCATCHSAGPGMPGTQALQAKYSGNIPAVITQRSDLTPELIAFYVRNGISVMPFFRKTEITDRDLDALTRYIVNSASSSAN